MVAYPSRPQQLPAESPSPWHIGARSEGSSLSEQTLRAASWSTNAPPHQTLLEASTNNKDRLKKALELYNEMAAEASRASDVARICDDNKVDGVVRGKTGKRPLRPPSLDQLSLVQQIDNLKAEFVEKKRNRTRGSFGAVSCSCALFSLFQSGTTRPCSREIAAVAKRTSAAR